jgi:hypothetical protein
MCRGHQVRCVCALRRRSAPNVFQTQVQVPAKSLHGPMYVHERVFDELEAAVCENEEPGLCEGGQQNGGFVVSEGLRVLGRQVRVGMEPNTGQATKFSEIRLIHGYIPSRLRFNFQSC